MKPQRRVDTEFIDRCMLLWSSGMDTHAIHKQLMEPEYVIERAIWDGLELKKRRDGKWKG